MVADPSGSWTPGTAEQYIDQQVAVLNTNISNEILARQTADQGLQNQINSEATTRANVDNTKADKATTLAGYGITNAYTKTEVNDLVDTPHQNYVTVQTYSALPATGSADTIYRVSNYDGSVPEVNVTKYSEYAWQGTQYIFLCVKSQIDEVFDITVYHSNTTYSDLAAALGTDGANVPPTLRRGGMSVKYVQSSDNKYVQYRNMSDTFNTTASNWQGVDDEPTEDSHNLVESGGIAKSIAINTKGYIVYKNYIFNKYLDLNGIAQNNNAGQLGVTDFIDVTSVVSIELNVGFWNYANHLDYAFYDNSKTYISNSGGRVDSSNVYYIHDIPSNAKYLRCTFYESSGDFSGLYVKTSYASDVNNYVRQTFDCVLYVTKDGRYGYNNIQSAVNFAKTIMSVNNQVTIFVGEGEFPRFDLKGANSYISIIGCGREKTKVKSTTGLYATPAATITTNGIIKGITFIATHDDIQSLNGDPGSYAVHSDEHYAGETERLTVYEDCDFISYQSSGFGCGMSANETLIMRNCGFYSYYTRTFNPQEYIYKRYASLLVHGDIHGDNNPTKFVVENCKGYSLDCDVAIHLDDYLSTNIVFEVRNCQFYSKIGGTNMYNVGLTLSPLSYNNNVPELNYNYSVE